MQITNYKKVADATKDLGKHVYGDRLELFLDSRTGELGTEYQIADTSCTVYHTPAIIKIGDIRRPSTEADIREMIDRRLCELAMEAENLAEAEREVAALMAARMAAWTA